MTIAQTTYPVPTQLLDQLEPRSAETGVCYHNWMASIVKDFFELVEEGFMGGRLLFGIKVMHLFVQAQ